METGDKVSVLLVMKVKDYYRFLIRKRSREPDVIYFWNSFIDLYYDFVLKEFIFI